MQIKDGCSCAPSLLPCIEGFAHRPSFLLASGGWNQLILIWPAHGHCMRCPAQQLISCLAVSSSLLVAAGGPAGGANHSTRAHCYSGLTITPPLTGSCPLAAGRPAGGPHCPRGRDCAEVPSPAADDCVQHPSLCRGGRVFAEGGRSSWQAAEGGHCRRGGSCSPGAA